MDSAALMIQCQMALNLTQKELGALVGKDRRTIQRWQDKGCNLLLSDEAEALANALRPVRPDLADEVLALGARYTVGAVAVPPPRPVTPQVIEAILGAAARTGGSSPSAVEAFVEAAFEQAAQAGVEAGAVVEAMRARRRAR